MGTSRMRLHATIESFLRYKSCMTFARMRLRLLAFTFALATLPSSYWQVSASEAGFETIFDGKTLTGWHASAKTGHSRASKNTTGGKWVVVDGAIVGSQDIPGNGGIIITDEQFDDFVVALE